MSQPNYHAELQDAYEQFLREREAFWDKYGKDEQTLLFEEWLCDN